MKKLLGLVAVLTVLNGALLFTTHRASQSAAPVAAPAASEVLNSSIHAPHARGPQSEGPARQEAKAPPPSPSMAPGEENADPARVQRRADEERALREIREKTAEAMANAKN